MSDWYLENIQRRTWRQEWKSWAILVFTLAFVLLLALALNGCVTAPHEDQNHVWYKPGATPLETQQALGSCRLFANREEFTERSYYAGDAAAWAGLAANNKRAQLVSDCMNEKGYILIDRRALPSESLSTPSKTTPRPEIKQNTSL